MSFMTLLRITGLAALLGAGFGADIASAQTQPADAALHAELRALRDRAVAAINKRDPDALMKELDPNVVFTAMNNEVVYGIDQAKAYYQRMLVGAGRVVESMTMTIDTDQLTKLYESNTVGIAAGNSTTHFKLSTGTEFDVPLRWSAAVHRADGKWSIVAVHFSANMFDNPALDTVKASTKWIAIACALIALVVGFFAGRWRRRRIA